MEKISKRLSYLNLLSVIFVTIGTIFGILTAVELGNNVKDGAISRTIVLIVVLVAALALLITGITGFFTSRKGDVKTTLIATGRHSSIQGIAPLTAGILAIVGLSVSASESGKPVNTTLIIFIVVSYVLYLFVTSLNNRGISAFRKDKGTYTYIAVTSYISVVTLLVFAIVSSIGMFNIPGIEGTHIVGFAEVFVIMFIMSALITHLNLALLATFAEKYAPKVTMADADSADLNKIADNVTKLVNNINTTPSKPSNNIEKIREYKALLDEGIITKEEFEAKKKELL